MTPLEHSVHPHATGSFELWESTVRGIVVRPTKKLSLLDLCCNECTVTSRLGCHTHIGVDVVDWPTRKPITGFVKIDVLNYLHLNSAAFDLCICSDGIEHLTKPQGLTLLKEMERIAELAIIFTPLGDYMVEPDSTHPDKHRSGWVPAELGSLGWSTKAFPRWHAAIGAGAFFAWKGSL